MQVRRLVVLTVAAVAALFCSEVARAQLTFTGVLFTPPAPTSADIIEAEIDFIGPGCWYSTATTVTGNLVETTIAVRDCLPYGNVPLGQFAQFGPLPAGNYAYRIYEKADSNPPELIDQGAFAVTQSPIPIPMFGTLAACSLVAALLLLALLRLHDW